MVIALEQEVPHTPGLKMGDDSYSQVDVGSQSLSMVILLARRQDLWLHQAQPAHRNCGKCPGAVNCSTFSGGCKFQGLGMSSLWLK